ncbi:sensor histidine kinase [Streptomyces sp. NPDC058701]|uniref:sensor histidine kinase n=1 Tax=Streptomyces sp. NPDC058701 TaxID=3346608 RepID=UPI003652A46A
MNSSTAPVFAEALREGLVRAAIRSPRAPRTPRLVALPGPASSAPPSAPPSAPQAPALEAAPPPGEHGKCGTHGEYGEYGEYGECGECGAHAAPPAVLLRTEAAAILRRFALALPSLRPAGGADLPRHEASCLAYARDVLLRAQGPAAATVGPAVPAVSGGSGGFAGEGPAVAPGGATPRHLVAAGTLLLECSLLQVTESGADGHAALARGLAVVRLLGDAVRAAGPGLWSGDGGGDSAWTESRRLAHHLHDEIGGALALAQHRIGLGEDDPEGAAAHLTAAKRALDEAARENRTLIGSLHRSSLTPPVRESLMRWLADVAPRVPVTVKVTGDETAAPERWRRELSFVLREAVRNCLAHAGAERIEVTVRTTRRWMYARVQDDGAGFAAEAGPGGAPQEPGTGYGLRSMRGRIEDLGGRLRVESAPGEGTRVEVHLPFGARQ